MPPRKQTYRRRTAAREGRAAPPADGGRYKTAGIIEQDRIRVLRIAGSGMFRDGATVGEFLRTVPSREAGIRVLWRAVRSGTIGVEEAKQ